MGPDGAFVEELRQFLANLYDHRTLQGLPLAGRLAPPDVKDPLQRARMVRSLVLRAIEQMSPGPGVAFRAPRARPHTILKLRYVEGLTVQEVAVELATSERTLYRELRRAEQDLALLLWEAHQQSEGRPLELEQLLAEEAQRAGGLSEDIHLETLLAGAQQALERLCARRQVCLLLSTHDDASQVRADALLVRQALINALSHFVQAVEPRTTVRVEATVCGEQIQFSLVGEVPPGLQPDELAASTAQHLVQRLGGSWRADVTVKGEAHVVFTMGGEPRRTVLVIDDNQSLLELFRRYLADGRYDLIGAADGREGLRLAEQHSPDAVVLDVMMPQNDGWEVLQWFQAGATTRHIPVIVCSVVNDPELALSLGATAFLSKPVDRSSLLKALERCRSRIQPPSHPRSAVDSE
ncbi:MAG: response regulator [Anaerolineae bacterium]